MQTITLRLGGFISKLRPTLYNIASLPRLAPFTSRPMSTETGFYSLKATLAWQQNIRLCGSQRKDCAYCQYGSQTGIGFTPQYKGLQGLYDKYKDRDFVILGFPCNQFGGQEPKDDEAIGEFCSRNHGVTFPLMKKSDVNGDNTNEVFKWLKNEKAGLLGLTRIKWNFEKFLVDKEGKVVHRWASTTTPDHIDVEVAKIL
ncbi:glutathione peroxidase [Armillaria borealis]|uniref:Glutathione peroxidase n=1 Tax=Armillaria borealis TaxID=47425 RepID=A0AA39JYR4_9AGAR|nr:glutathione peroxidase [Armillaria borealis]